MKKTILLLGAFTLLIPYITTLAWSGLPENGAAAEIYGESAQVMGKDIREDNGAALSRTVILDRGEEQTAVPLEEYLIGMVAGQIPADYETETIKAQAILARTYIYGQMGGETEIMESALDVDYEEPKDMKAADYRRIYEAVQSSEGVTAVYEGSYIDPLYHRLSAGGTRGGEAQHPYMRSVDCGEDYDAPEFYSRFSWTEEEFAAKLIGFGGDAKENAVSAEQIQVAETDAFGYVLSIQIGNEMYTGEEIQYALGLPSAAYIFGEEGGKISCTVRGAGHGYGFSQYNANERAKRGWTAEEMLKYYFKNIVLISE